VVATVAHNIDEPDQDPLGVAGCDPAEAVWADPIPPSVRGRAAARGDQLDQLGVVERAAPRKNYVYPATASSTRSGMSKFA
jgi:hypothetical protein